MTMTSSRSVDLRPIPPRDRHALVFKTFDALPRNDAVVLVFDHDPRPLLRELQKERAAAFDWSPLEEGPGVWRIELRRRAAETARTVLEFLGWDHDRLDSLLASVRGLLSSAKAEEAAGRFMEFRTGLLRHIRLEEEVLFPAFERITGQTGAGPTTVMRMEHSEIKKILDRMSEGFAASGMTAPRFESLRNDLVAVLGVHNEKEEQILYPMTDRGLPPGARTDLVDRLQAA
jgi:regulator of cell morphogenesis and NO signaling